jgi:hypothetical protein
LTSLLFQIYYFLKLSFPICQVHFAKMLDSQLHFAKSSTPHCQTVNSTLQVIHCQLAKLTSFSGLPPFSHWPLKLLIFCPILYMKAIVVSVCLCGQNFRSQEMRCRNPNLAKCGGEAQHLEKLGIWSPPGLPNVQSSTSRGKTPHTGVFLGSLERSWNVDIENALALAIQTSAAQVMGKRRVGSQTRRLTPDH